jgi:hypothetical protein
MESLVTSNEVVLESCFQTRDPKIAKWVFLYCACTGCIIHLNVIPVYGNRIGGVMVSMLALSAIDREFKPRAGQTKDYKICICCFSTQKHSFCNLWVSCLETAWAAVPKINLNLYSVIVNNLTNINKTNNQLSPQSTEHKKDHEIWYWWHSM